MTKLNIHVDITALQETKLPDSESAREANYTFNWQSFPTLDKRLYGVVFSVVKNRFPGVITSSLGKSERPNS